MAEQDTAPIEEEEEQEMVDETLEETATIAGASAEESGVETLKAEAEKNFAGWQRTLAEFQNYRRRVEREQEDMRQRIALDTIAKILPVLDDLERALASMPEEQHESPWVSGVSLISGKFNRLFEEYNITPLDPVGEEFDPNLHQAISREDSDKYDSGVVMETLQKGYISGETLVRPALVRVAN